MDLVTIEQLRHQCRVDPGDTTMDDQLILAGNAAEASCAKRANRALFADQAALDAALDAIPAAMVAARAAYDASIASANAYSDTRDRDTLLAVAKKRFDDIDMFHFRSLVGIIATADIIGAVLLTAAHFYVNREDVTVGQGAAAVAIPEGADAIMARHFYCGY